MARKYLILEGPEISFRLLQTDINVCAKAIFVKKNSRLGHYASILFFLYEDDDVILQQNFNLFFFDPGF
jgi:hypothetical protein